MFRHFPFSKSKRQNNFVDIALCPQEIQVLYRGFAAIPEVIFHLPTLALGIFGHSIPEYLTIEHIRMHKITNTPNVNHLVGMSKQPEIAACYGNGNFISIDPTLFRDNIADVHKTYKNHQRNFPGSMQKEEEQATLAVLYCCIKTIKLGGLTIENPFYLPIAADNEAAIKDFSNIYQFYLNLVRKQYAEGLTKAVAEDSFSFIKMYLGFYEKYSKQNPFKLSVAKLAQHYPDYMQHVLAINKERLTERSDANLFAAAPDFETYILQDAKHLFAQHHYTKDRKSIEKMQQEKVMTCYDDPYSCPAYD